MPKRGNPGGARGAATGLGRGLFGRGSSSKKSARPTGSVANRMGAEGPKKKTSPGVAAGKKIQAYQKVEARKQAAAAEKSRQQGSVAGQRFQANQATKKRKTTAAGKKAAASTQSGLRKRGR
jgi:hypothetical protein